MRGALKILPYQHVFWGPADQVEVEHYQELIESGGYTFRPLHCPGHSKDMSCFFVEEEGWLFSGDLCLADKVKFFRVDENFAEQIDSLTKLLDYDFDKLFCSHRPCMKNGKERVKGKLEFMHDLAGQVINLKKKGLEDKEILRRLVKKESWAIKIITLGNASAANMIRSAIRTVGE